MDSQQPYTPGTPPIPATSPAVAPSVAPQPMVPPAAQPAVQAPIPGSAPTGFIPGQAAQAPEQGVPPVGQFPQNSTFNGKQVNSQTMTKEEIDAAFQKSQRKANIPEYGQLLLKQGDNYMRLVGKYKKIKIHWIAGDDGTTRPYKCEDNCPICELTSPFMAYQLVENTNPQSRTKMRRKYSYEELYPALSKKITGDSSLGISGWGPKERHLFNVIDRVGTWCAENKHTMVLAYSAKSIGIGSKCAEQIWALGHEYGPFNRYDLKISKAGVQRNTVYTVMIRANGMFPLTETETKYALYDLDKIFEAYTSPNQLFEDAPSQVKDILNFLSTQGIINSSPFLMKIAKQFNISTETAAPPLNTNVPQNPINPAPPISAPAPIPVAQPAPPPPPIATDPAPITPTTTVPPVQAPEQPTGNSKECAKCGESNNPIDAKQCKFCGALFG